MRLKIRALTVIAVTVGLLFTMAAFSGKKTFEIQKPSSSMVVQGTSSLHDWKIELKDFRGEMSAVADGSNMKIEAVTFRGKAKSLKSDNSTMDGKTYDALKVDKHPDITYAIKSSRDVQIKDKKFTGLITGDLTIAGKTRQETIQFSGVMISDNKMQIRGSKKLRMSDFGVDPPTAMLGALKTGNDVTITFILIMALK
ncbi:MAG TPA: YceI family protein [Bacteroidales bacterium]|nr:YceI family protein [Bacteroidales bacterium]HRZ48757.1 YceI family protein [Bacteroidales bacterium]